MTKKTELPQKLWIVVPLFNHGSTVSNIVDKVACYTKNIVVVDDGSTDCNIEKLLQNSPAILLKHHNNRGKGTALMTAAEYIKNAGGNSMLTIDADGQHNPDDIQNIQDLLNNNPKEIIIGVRDFRTSNIPLKSRIGRCLSNIAVLLETGHSVGDSQSGFRVYPLETFFIDKLKTIRFSFETEILVLALRNGYRVAKRDISVYYPAGRKRITHFKPLADNLRVCLLHIRLLLTSHILSHFTTLVRRKLGKPS